MRSKTAKYVAVILGLLLLAIGLYLVKTGDDPQGTQDIMRALPYVCIGIGSGLFGHGMGEVMAARAIGRDPDLVKKMHIEKNDERNLAIANKAKGKTFDMMTFVFGAFILSFGIMGIDTMALLLLVFAYLLVHGVALYYRWRFGKEM